MSYYLSPIGNRQFVDSNGNPLSGAKLFTYVAGSSTKSTVYKDSAAAASHTNPIVLDSNGSPASPIWLDGSVTYKFVLAPSNDTDPPASPYYSWDNIDGVNSALVSGITEWLTGPTPTYVSATSFTLVGDQSSTFHVGRRLKTTNSGGTVYSTITAVAYTTLTTITVVNDSGTLDAGLSAVYYSILSADNPSLPFGIDYQAMNDGAVIVPAPGGGATQSWVPKYALSGLSMAISTTDTVNDITVQVGECADSTGVMMLKLTSAMTKQLDASWAVGSAAGGLDTGAEAISTYYFVWLIRKDSDGTIDVLISASSSSPTMPSGYTYKRLIGSFYNNASSQIEAVSPFSQRFMIFTASGTFPVPAWVNQIKVKAQASGGGGGSGSRSSGGTGLTTAGGGGGAAGEYKEQWVQTTPGGTETVTIGAAGTGGTGDTGAGANGTDASDTTVGSSFTALGGKKGYSGANGAQGGAVGAAPGGGTTGDTWKEEYGHSAGDGGHGGVSSTISGNGGGGGTSMYGIGGAGGAASTVGSGSNGSTAANYGAGGGGGGGSNYSSGSGGNGGDGYKGFVVVEW